VKNDSISTINIIIVIQVVMKMMITRSIFDWDEERLRFESILSWLSYQSVNTNVIMVMSSHKRTRSIVTQILNLINAAVVIKHITDVNIKANT
jgi:hypothetical protein